MEIDLKGKVAIVTGAGRGIGRVIAQTLAREGVRVVVADIRQAFLDDVTAEWQREGWEGLQVICDVRDNASCAAAVAAAEGAYGRVDILVNNAGVASGRRVVEMPDEAWNANIDINLSGTMRMCRAVIPTMQKQNVGRIINAASFAAIIPGIGGAAYASSKAGVEMFSRALAGELGPHNITVNSYAPGMIPTEMNHFAERDETTQERLLDTLTLRRWGDPADVANLICFLSSDLAAYITGTMIDVSGGKFATQFPWMAHREFVSPVGDITAEYRAAIAAVRPDLAALPMVLHTRGWDSNAVEAGDTIFKFPKHADAPDRLRREAKFLALIAPRVPLAVPRMKLHETPILFSEHVMIPGTIIETAGYDALGEVQKDAMAAALAGFYAALHAIPLAEAIAAGAEPKPGWPDAAAVLPQLHGRLPVPILDFAERVFADYLELPHEEDIFGYFDGHGWNMAFDHERGVLNGVYDFADAAIGPLTREFTYSNLTSPDLTQRLIAAYEGITGKAIDRRAVDIRTTIQHLSELADLEGDGVDEFARTVAQWCEVRLQ